MVEVSNKLRLLIALSTANFIEKSKKIPNINDFPPEVTDIDIARFVAEKEGVNIFIASEMVDVVRNNKKAVDLIYTPAYEQGKAKARQKDT